MAGRRVINLDGVEVLLADAIRTGLEKADANMVRVTNDIMNQAEVDDAFSHFEVDIVPYEIPDTSLTQIVLKAPQYVIDEIMEALAERRRLAEFGGSNEGRN